MQSHEVSAIKVRREMLTNFDSAKNENFVTLEIPRKDKLHFEPSANDENDDEVPLIAEKQPNCITEKYRRNITLISIGLILTFAAVFLAVMILSNKISPREYGNFSINPSPSGQIGILLYAVIAVVS
uniref:Uncharacterized protein n=1 Tax=Plectus sambesii TaxID=2011161 RepID=A0A914XDA1_9BILA